jgi:hypothetical protein
VPAHLRIGPEGLEERAGRPLREKAKAAFALSERSERSSNEVLLKRSDRC